MRSAGERRGTSRQAAGFTLVEMLVVIGIIAAVVTLALPAIGRARESGRRVACLANIRDLTHAALLYAADNDGVLPDACGTNWLESPMSPQANGRAPGGKLLPPNAVGSAVVLASIGGPLAPYLSNTDGRVWRCPDMPDSKFSLTGVNPYTGLSAGNPAAGVLADAFVPSYHYLCDKEFLRDALIGGPVFTPIRLRDWAVRNVAGLRIGRIAPLGANASIVLFHDSDPTFHADGPPSMSGASGTTVYNIYTAPATLNWNYYDNFGYLDGHAAGHSFRNVDEYLGSIHGPIRQSWYGTDFPSAFPEEYAGL